MTSAIVTPDDLVTFPYPDHHRVVLVTRVWQSAAGDDLITGLDEDRNEMRTFRVDRIPAQRVRKVK